MSLPATVSVRVINGQSESGAIQNLNLPETTTIREVLQMNKVNLDKMTVTVKVDGDRIPYDLDDEIQEGMSITISPEQVKGAAA